MTVSVISADTQTPLIRTFRAAGPAGESLLCDRLYAFGDRAGEFTLQHRCGGNTAPWGYRIAAPLRAIAITPVTEQGVDWTRNGVPQYRMSPHVEAADYSFTGPSRTARTAPSSPTRTTTRSDTDERGWGHEHLDQGRVHVEQRPGMIAATTGGAESIDVVILGQLRTSRPS